MQNTVLTTEDNILLALSSPIKLGQDISMLQQSMEQITTWEQVVTTAILHGLAPLVFHNLKLTHLLAFCPPFYAEHLQQAYYHTLAANTRIYRALDEILEKFNANGIETILLKGVSLAEFVYDDPALRHMGDIDLLIRKSDIDLAESLMLTLGYREAIPPKREFIKKLRLRYDSQFVKNELLVEIHWNIHIEHGLTVVDPDILWQNKVLSKLNNQETSILSPEDTLIHLCLHLFGHLKFMGLLRLNWFTDILMVLQKYDGRLNLVSVYENQHKKMRHVLNQVFGILSKYYGASSSSMPEIDHSFPESSTMDFFIAVLQGKNLPKDSLIERHYSLISKNIPGFWLKIKVLLGEIFPSVRFMKAFYGNRPIFILYLSRMIRIVGKGIRSLLQKSVT